MTELLNSHVIGALQLATPKDPKAQAEHLLYSRLAWLGRDLRDGDVVYVVHQVDGEELHSARCVKIVEGKMQYRAMDDNVHDVVTEDCARVAGVIVGKQVDFDTR